MCSVLVDEGKKRNKKKPVFSNILIEELVVKRIPLNDHRDHMLPLFGILDDACVDNFLLLVADFLHICCFDLRIICTHGSFGRIISAVQRIPVNDHRDHMLPSFDILDDICME